MGKTGKWFKTFLTGKKEKEKEKEKGADEPAQLPTNNQSAPAPVPGPKEKKRWSFRRSTAAGRELTNAAKMGTTAPAAAANGPSEPERKRHALAVAVATAAAADAAVAAAQAAAAVVHLTATANCSRRRADRDLEEDAATKIQSCFRSYLARKALCALKGLVMLQALVRGDLVRRQATETLRRMQALVTAQVRARTQRIQMLEEEQTNSQRQTSYRTSPQHPRLRQAYEMEKNAEENIKIVEMDLGEPRSTLKSRNSCYSIPYSERTDHRHSAYYPSSRTPSKTDTPQQYCPSPSAYTDISPKACSAHFEDFSFVTAQSSPQYYSAMSITDSTQTSIDYSFFPNYMANTQSSRAKARSQSAPRQRLDSYERQSSRRRPSMEGRNIPRGVKMQRSSSHVGLEAKGYQFPWSLKLDRSNVSVKDSDCGSTSTVLTNYRYCTEGRP